MASHNLIYTRNNGQHHAPTTNRRKEYSKMSQKLLLPAAQVLKLTGAELWGLYQYQVM